MKISKVFLALILTTSLFLLPQCSSDSGGQKSGSNTLIPAVEAVQAQYGSLPLTERLSGVVKGKNQVDVYPEVSAIVQEVEVENGDLVEKGAPLVRLRDREFRERLNQAKAGLQIASAQAKQAEARLQESQSTLERTEAMAKQNLISATELEKVQTQAVSAQADYELAQAQVAQAQATVDERQEALSHTVVRAPVEGTVGNRNAEIGMLVGSSTRLFTVGQLDSVRVEVILTDQMLNYIEVGQKSDVFSENSSFSKSAKLSRISPFLHPVTHSTEAEIDMANPDKVLKPGMFVTVDINYGESQQATLVPLSALYENPATGGVGVYRSVATMPQQEATPVDDPQHGALTDPLGFVFTPVDVIAKGRMEAGIRGIDPDDWVVTIGQDLLGGDTARARVRVVSWDWVKQLQNLQREDLLEEVVQEHPGASQDSTSLLPQQPKSD